MGIKNLNYIIEQYSTNGKQTINLSKLANKKLAIDTNVYLYKFLYGKHNHIDGMFFMINKLKKYNIEPIFIFDGKPPEEKRDTIEQRKQAKLKLKEKIEQLEERLDTSSDIVEKDIIEQEISNIEKKIIYVDRDIINSTKELFNLMGISYVHSNCEAEQYCSKLCVNGLVDGVITEDMDTIASGCKNVYRNFSNRTDTITEYSIDKILFDLDMSYDLFLDLCIILGNDYIPRYRGFTPDDCYQLIKTIGSIENIVEKGHLQMASIEYNRIRSIYRLTGIELIPEETIKTDIDIDKIKEFLKTKSTIDEKIFSNRLELIYRPRVEREILLEESRYRPNYISKKKKKIEKPKSIFFLTECLIDDC